MKKYEKYKDSGIEWIGEIPKHWKVSRIKFYLDYQKGKNPKELKHSESNESEIYLAMDYLRGNPKQMLYVEDVENYVKVDENEILLLWDGSNAGEFVLSRKGILSSTMAILNLKNIQKEYSWYFFKHFEPQLKKSTIGMGVPHVNGEELKNGYIALPPLEEQTAIANYLDQKTAEIDELISKKEQLLKLCEEEKTAIINQAVTKGINPDVKLKDSGIDWLGEIPEHWEVKKLKYLTKGVITGKTPPSSNLSYYNGDIDWFAPGDFNNRLVLKNSKRKITEQAITEAGMKIYPPNSVLLVGIGATLGKLGITINSSTSNQQINAIIFDEKKINPFYGLYFLLSFKNAIIRLANSATLAIFNQTQTKEFEVFVPEKEEQFAIVKYIETECARINAKVEKIKKLIDLLTEYRTALISEVVTGKIKVTE